MGIALHVEPPVVIDALDVTPARDGFGWMRIQTPLGQIRGCLHEAPGSTLGVVMVGGAGGGVTGPASVYPDLAEELRAQGITSLRLDFRQANDLEECVWDTLAGIEALARRGIERIALVGWSFGGAVVITAGAANERVAAVATVASQTAGTDTVGMLSPRPVLFLHGTGDRTLPYSCSADLYRRAGEPRELEIYPGANHGLDQVRTQMKERLRDWLVATLRSAG